MTKKLFWQDPYLTEFETTVETVNGNQVILKETIFYAFSGGQESDEGTIGGYKVLGAKKVDKEIVYMLEDNHSLKANDLVTIKINWEHRYKLMRLHFAAEIVLELVYQQFPNMQKVGAHIGEEKARIDFQFTENFSALVASVQQKAQAIIDLDQPIISAFSDEANERRYWKINEFSQVPCGGTHVKRTSEIGKISLKRVNPGKGKERIEICLQ